MIRRSIPDHVHIIHRDAYASCASYSVNMQAGAKISPQFRLQRKNHVSVL